MISEGVPIHLYVREGYHRLNETLISNHSCSTLCRSSMMSGVAPALIAHVQVAPRPLALSDDEDTLRLLSAPADLTVGKDWSRNPDVRDNFVRSMKYELFRDGNTYAAM